MPATRHRDGQDGGDERQGHAEQRAEDEEQHDGRSRQADDLGEALLRRRHGGRAGDLDLHAVACPVGDRLDDVGDLRLRDVVGDEAVEDDGGEGGAPVAGDLRGAGRVVRRRDRRDVTEVLRGRERGGEALPDRGVGDLPLLDVHDGADLVAGGGRAHLLQQLQRLRALRVGQGELVVVAGADAAEGTADHEQGEQPGGQHPAAAAEAEAGETTHGCCSSRGWRAPSIRTRLTGRQVS